jgi:cation/acetate symporter
MSSLRSGSVESTRRFAGKLHRRYGLFTPGGGAVRCGAGAAGTAGLVARLDRRHLPDRHGAGVCRHRLACCRTTDEAEYYVAGRRVPAMYNGMATAADWMSAASFIGTAGVLYLQGFAGLAYILGWTGGYCLVACCWRPTCGASASTPSRTSWARATAARRPRLIGGRGGAGVLRLRGGADLRRGPDHLAPDRFSASRSASSSAWAACWCAQLPGRHARRHLDPGGAVHRADHCLPGAGGVAVATTRPGPWLPVLSYGQQLEVVSERETQLLTDPAESRCAAC